MRTLLVSTFLVILAVVLTGQQPDQPSRATRPQFRSVVDAVVIDLRVVDADGVFVRGLSRDDFQIVEDGQEQSIDTLELIDLPVHRPGPLTTGARVEPDVSNNEVSTEGRVYVLVLDDMVGRSGDARGSEDFVAPVRAFVEQHMAAGDLAALITTSGRKDMAVPFTDSRERLLEVLDRFALGYGPEYGRRTAWTGSPASALRPGLGRIDRDGSSLTEFIPRDERATRLSLHALARWLEGINTKRKAIVLFAGGDVLRTAMTGACGRSLLLGSEALWGQEREETRMVIEAAGRGNVTIYPLVPVLPDGLLRSPLAEDGALDWAYTSAPSPAVDRGRADPVTCKQGIGAIARDTGGFVSFTTPAAFDRVVTETSAYYMLGYSPIDKTQDDRFRRIEVRVNRPGLHVMARSGYTSKPSPWDRGRTPSDMLPGLADVLQSPLPVPDLRLSIAAASFRDASSRPVVNVIVEANVQELFFDARGEPNTEMLLTEIVAATVDGDVKAANSATLTMAAPVPENLEQIERDGVRLLHQLSVKPGRYHVRVAAYGRNSERGGSVHREIVVPDFSKRALTMSDVAFGESSASQPFTTGPNAPWTHTLGMTPTARRDFSRNDLLSVYAELYDNARSPGPITVDTIVRSDTGEPVFLRQQTITPVTDPARPRVHPLTTQIPLAAFSAGPYVLEIDARGQAQSDAASRRVPFAVE